MKVSHTTTRLLLYELCLDDEKFITELVNTPEWITKFWEDETI